MITLSATAQAVLNGSYRYYLSVDSWLGGQLLADEVPVSAATEEVDRSLRVPERVTLTVPRVDRGVSWAPIGATHPLAANGQRLRVQLGVGLDGTAVEWFTRGWFLIQDSAVSGDEVSVTAVGLLSLIEEAHLVSPFQPNGTLVSTLRDLVEPALTVVVDASLTDRSVPTTVNFDDDRLAAVLGLLDAWAADGKVDANGFLAVAAASQSVVPVLALTDGTGGTIITASGSSTRDGAFNVVVARGTATDGGLIQGVAYDLSGGPKAYGGAFNPLPVPYFFQSPLLTTVGQCQQAAATILDRKRRETAAQFDVEMVPHPALQVGDVVSITTDNYTALPCSVESLTLPYVADGGAQRLRLRSLA